MGKRGGGDSQLLLHLSGNHPVRVSGEKQAKNLQTRLSPKRRKAVGRARNQQRIRPLHISMIAEIGKLVNRPASPNSFPLRRIPTNGGSQALGTGKLLETPMHLTFDPVSAAWDTFRFWDNHETSTDNPICHISGTCRRSRHRSDAREPARREKAPAASPGASHGPTSHGQRSFR